MEVSAIRLLIVLCLITIFLLINSKWYKDLTQYSEDVDLRKIAKKDLSMIGEIGHAFEVSLTQWLYSILVICYRKDEKLQVMPLIREWYSVGVDSSVSYDIERPYTRFLTVIDEANQKKEDMPSKADEIKPTFGVSVEYDYHVLPKVLKYNDYVDCVGLMKVIDETIGGAVNE